MDIANKKLFKQQCFIDGEWVDSQSKRTIDVNNPATQEIVGNVPKCGKIETNNAIKAANNSWNEWRLKTKSKLGPLETTGIHYVDFINRIFNKYNILNLFLFSQTKRSNKEQQKRF